MTDALCEDEGCPHHGTPHVCNLTDAPMIPALARLAAWTAFNDASQQLRPQAECIQAALTAALPFIAEEMRKWRDMSDAPTDGTVIVACYHDGSLALATWDELEDSGWLNSETLDEVAFPAGWYPVPDYGAFLAIRAAGGKS